MHLALLLLAALLLASCSGNQQEDQGQQQEENENKPRTVRLTRLLEKPQRYYQKIVLVRNGQVSEVIEPRAFVVEPRQGAQEDTSGEGGSARSSLLVISTGESQPDLIAGQDVRLRGTLRRNLEIATVEKNNQRVQLDDALYEDYAGKRFFAARQVRTVQGEETTQ